MVLQLILVSVFLSILVTGLAIWTALQAFRHPHPMIIEEGGEKRFIERNATTTSYPCCMGRRFWELLELAPEFQRLLLPPNNTAAESAETAQNPPPLFLLEPYLLGQLYKAKVISHTSSLEDGEEAFRQLKWRFDLTDQHLFAWQPDSLLVGAFAEDFSEEGGGGGPANLQLQASSFVETRRVVGDLEGGSEPKSFNFFQSNNKRPLHVFYEHGLEPQANATSVGATTAAPTSFSKWVLWLFGFGSSTKKKTKPKRSNPLKLHLVLFHRMESFLYVGPAIQDNFEEDFGEKLYQQQQQQQPNSFNESQSSSSSSGDYRDHFTTAYPMAFAGQPLFLTTFGGLVVPWEPQHLLGQLPSARYLHCSSSVSAKNATEDHHHHQQNNSNQALLADAHLKSVLHSLRSVLTSRLYMNWWLWSRTLISWRRQCTLLTSDSADHPRLTFGTWASYASEDDVSYSIEQMIRNLAPSNGLDFISGKGGGGDDGASNLLSMKHSNPAFDDHLQVDLHFIADWSNATSSNIEMEKKKKEKVFTLCSASLVGVKVLVPCEPEAPFLFLGK